MAQNDEHESCLLCLGEGTVCRLLTPKATEGRAKHLKAALWEEVLGW